jgi:tetratricopeptide (TPR) repeat protein
VIAAWQALGYPRLDGLPKLLAMTDSHAILGEALELHQARRHAEAAALYQRALELDPDEPTALYLFGLLQFETGQIDSAIGLLTKVVATRPDHAQARFTLANLQHWRGDFAAAAENYAAVIERQAQHLGAMIGLAKALRDQGELDAAMTACRKAIEVDPDSAAAHEARASILSAQGRAANAVEAYRTAVMLQPDLASAQVGLALALLAEDRAPEALAAADGALALQADMADAWFARGSALAALRRLPAAIEALEQCARLDPDQALAHLHLGNLYGELERGEEAIAHLRHAIGLEPTLKEAHASLGSLYLLTGQKAEAEQFSWLALAIDPDMVAPHQNLASLLAERGETTQAKFHRDAAYSAQNVFVEAAAHPLRRVLVLATAESGNVPFKFLLPRERFTRIRWVIEYAREGQAAELPPYDVVFNAIGDPDLAGPTKSPVQQFLATCDKPVFNDPAKIERTCRDRTGALLTGLADVHVPPTRRLTAETLANQNIAERLRAEDMGWPLLIRPIGSHGGQGMIKLDGAADLAAAAVPSDRDLYVTAFRDYQSTDGAWRKYRMIFVDRRPYAYHLAISDHWLVHHGTAEMAPRPDRLAEEMRFLKDPEAAIGPKAMAAVAAIGARLDLDYCGVDFAVLPDDSVLVFEANATMLVHPEAENGALAPKNPYVERILEAFQAMIIGDSPTSAAD